jgi:membrane-bound lytic murein transglycosylase B
VLRVAQRLAVLAGALCLAPLSAAQTQGSYGDREEVHQFATDVCGRNDELDQTAVMETLAQAQYQDAVVRAMEPVPPGLRSWRQYRSRFVNEQHIRDGLVFWEKHRAELARAARTYGVPEEIIVAIIGVESGYGRNMGEFRTLDALATLAFDYPRRAAFFRDELEQFLIFAHDERVAADSLRSSFAGAMGIPQFMPGSIRKWAVDFDGDGRRDLITSAADAIGSVGNFLSKHGWQPGQTAAVPAVVSGDRYRLLLEFGVQPTIWAGELSDFEVKALSPLRADTPVALVELESPHEASAFYLGLQNFYVVTRYNQSSFYAISVIELAHKLTLRSVVRSAHRKPGQHGSTPPH